MTRLLPKDFADELTSTPYKHVRVLAKGGMGEVHVVEHRELGGEVVLKVIRAHLLEQEEHLTLRLRAEGRALRAVRHPNLVDVVDFGFTSAGRAYLVTELLQGETLKDALKARKVLPFAEVKALLRQILSGLIAAHAQHVVHRDSKPDNLFWCRPGPDGKRALEILDFGVAKLLTEEAKARVGQVAATKTGMVVGTPLYLSPEQALAQPIDERADLYSLGCVAFHLAVGRPPFVATPGPNAGLELLQAHLTEVPPTPSTLARLSPAFDAWVLKAMSKRPADRFASAPEMLAALERIEEHAAAAPPPTQSMAAPHTSPRPAMAGTLPLSAAGPTMAGSPRPVAAPAMAGTLPLSTAQSPGPSSPVAATLSEQLRAAPARAMPMTPPTVRLESVHPNPRAGVRRLDVEAAIGPLMNITPRAPATAPTSKIPKGLLPTLGLAVVLGLVLVVVLYFVGRRP